MSAKPTKEPKLFLTVGHSTHPLEEFLALLRTHEVTRLADVRKMPRSATNPQFNIDTLPLALKGAGIDYVHLPGLGGLRRPRPDSPNGAWRNRSFQGYADYMLTAEFTAALEELIELGRRQRVVLMCAEAVPWRCHRSLIADALVARGFTVEDILGPGRRQVHKLREWACLCGTEVTYPATEPVG